LALCGNHHLAFDKHVVGVRTETSEVAFRRSSTRHRRATLLRRWLTPRSSGLPSRVFELRAPGPRCSSSVTSSSPTATSG
jgi:hypothetical protein